jgi:hypothetical protein
MLLKDWWKSKRYWVKGLIIGFFVSIIIDVLLAWYTGRHILSPEPLKFIEYLESFIYALRFFIPVGLLTGLIIGAIIDKIKSN